MIVRKVDGAVSLIRQNDHARQCREIAGAWRPELLGPGLCPEILDAVLEHDNGWIEWDARPTLNPGSGLPYQFFQMPVREHLEIFTRGVQRAANLDPYVGLLVSMHGVGLYNGRYGLVPAFAPRHLDGAEQELADAFVAKQEAIQKSLRERLAGDEAYASIADDNSIWDVYLTLQIWDWLSLSCLTGPLSSHEIGPLPAGSGIENLRFEPDEAGVIRIWPYPFAADSVVTSVPFRTLRLSSYESQAALDTELDGAAEELLTFKMIPGKSLTPESA